MIQEVYNMLMDSMEPKDPLNELPVKTRVKLFVIQWSVWLVLFVTPLSIITALGVYLILSNIGGQF